jgi:hypothetical protein
MALGVLAGCDGSGSSVAVPGGDPDAARLSIEMTDAPFPYEMVERADVLIDSVSVRIEALEPESSGFVSVSRESQSLNLLELQNGVTAAIAEAEVPVGVVEQIRLHVGQASVTLADGREFELTIPSGDRSGIKIFPSPPFEVAGAIPTGVLLDFDVSRSFHPVPSGARRVEEVESFTFRPSLKAVLLETSGSIEGTVWDDGWTPGYPADDIPLPDAAVTVYRIEEEVASTASGEGGDFVVMGLDAAEYRIESTRGGYLPAAAAVTLVAGSQPPRVELRMTPDFF